MIVGSSGAPGEESFDVTFCSPEWLAKTSREVGGLYNARHHLVVLVEDFSLARRPGFLSDLVRGL
jgi:hypothetical protein